MTLIYNDKIQATVATATLTPLQQYSVWATELGVDDSTTDQSLNGDDRLYVLDFGGSFLKTLAGISTGTFSSEMNLGFYLATITDQTSTIFSVTGKNRSVACVDKPDVMLTFAPNVDGETKETKIRTVGSTTIIYGRYRQYGDDVNVLHFAIKIENYKITLALNSVDAAYPVSFDVWNAANVWQSQTVLLTQAAGDNHLITLEFVTYKYNITIDESLAVDKFDVFVYYAETGELQSKTTLSTSGGVMSTDITTLDTELVTITVAVAANQWRANHAYAVGDVVYPTQPALNSHYFKRVALGTSGTNEPTWSTNIGVKCNDGAVNDAWECVSTLIQPVTNSYLKPS